MNKVVIGIVNINGKLLMIERVKDEGTLLWAFPGGKVEDGETLEDACIREIKEETNINVKILAKLGNRIHPNTKISITYFLCDYIDGDIKIINYDEIKAIELKDYQQFMKDVKTDIYPKVMKYIVNNIK